MTTMMDAQFDRLRAKDIARGYALGLEQGRALGLAQSEAQGMEQGMEQGMVQGCVDLLKLQAEQRFGAGVAGRMAALLSDVLDMARLVEVGRWLVVCDSGQALLKRLPAIVQGTGNAASS